MSDQHVCYDCERDFAAVCRKCSDDKVAALRAQLAAVEKERDAERVRANDARDKMYNTVAELNVVRNRAAALEPTALASNLYAEEHNSEWSRAPAHWRKWMLTKARNIRARAGLTKEGT